MKRPNCLRETDQRKKRGIYPKTELKGCIDTLDPNKNPSGVTQPGKTLRKC